MNEDFITLGLEKDILQAVNYLGFEKPTSIQKKCIPIVLNKKTDLVALAQTGTGKTAAFGLPLIQKITTHSNNIQALILAPTRELCIQITEDLKNFARVKKTKILALYGGASISDQVRNLKKGVQIIVATPGRLQDIINRRLVILSNVNYLIIDEADEMLNMGFQEAIDKILETVSKKRNTWLFSATMPNSVSKIIYQYMNDPIEVTCGIKNQSASTVNHYYYLINHKTRYKALRRVIDYNPFFYAIIFCRTRAETQNITDRLQTDGFNTDGLHGDMSQMQRDAVMKKFKKKKITILVATDVASRGIDVDNISHVVHYQLPDDVEVYTHRSGRTGRAGNLGKSISLIGAKDMHKLKKIEKTLNFKIEKKNIPSNSEVIKALVTKSIDDLLNSKINEKSLKPLKKIICDISEKITSKEILEKFISHSLSKMIDLYEDSEDLNSLNKKQLVRSERVFINIGEKDGLNWATLKDLLINKTSLNDEDLGGVDVKRSFSFFNVSKEKIKGVFKSLKGFSLGGRDVVIEISKKSKEKNSIKIKKARSAHSNTKERTKLKSRKHKRNKKK